MVKRILPWAKGAFAPVLAMAIFAIPLGLFMALVLLVVAMEESNATSSAGALPLTRAVVLLSQGVGFRAGQVTVGVTPLLLTILLIALVRSICLRLRVRGRTWIVGTLIWVGIDCLMLNGLGMRVQDPTAMIALKGSIVYSAGFVWATLTRASWYDGARRYVHAHVSVPVLHACRTGLLLGCAIVATVLCVGLFTVCGWAILDHRRIGSMCELLGMQSGSRILMVVMSLAWLPNAVLWACAWLFGGTFHIGEAASYAMGAVHVHALPSLPMFALFLGSPTSPTFRVWAMAVPLAIGVVAGLTVMTMHRGFGMRPWKPSVSNLRTLLMKFTYPLGAMLIASAFVALAMSLLFACSNGALGTGRLASVGVDTAHASNVVARPSALGLCAAWGLELVIALAAHGIRRLTGHATPDSASTDPSRPAAGPKEEEKKTRFTARVVNSTPQPKEKQGDDEPTVTTGLGVRLP
ncbi:MAG: DUF6350 family protein [Bifidobacterium sp.]|nr:DUF6350 family protein [Bifidobacterium sp.]